jgi:hypothetical protein
MRVPGHHTADEMKQMNCQSHVETPTGKGWVLARPEPYFHWTKRWTLAWLVFTGKADAVTWIGQ